MKFYYNVIFKAIKLKNKVLYKSTSLKKHDSTSQITNQELTDYNENRFLGYQPHICNAPITSMYLSYDGNVLACCKNRNYNLGNIENNTLLEIWNGEKKTKLVNKLDNYNFELGCQGCKEGIKAKKYSNVMAASYDNFDVSKKPNFPKRIDFELSSTCNLACRMCDGQLSSTYRKHFQGLPALKNPYTNDFLKQLKYFLPHLKKANFLGGEPFLIDMYFDIWEQILEVNPKCNMHLQTNGHILNEKIKTLLEKGDFSIGMSLESIQKERFENIRVFGNFEKFMNNFQYFKSYCKRKKTYFNFAFTPMRETIDELPDFIHFANKEGVNIYLNTLTEPHDMALWSLSPDPIRVIVNDLEKVLFPQNTILEKENAKQYFSYINLLKSWLSESIIRDEKIKNDDKVLSNDDLQDILITRCDQYVKKHTQDVESKIYFYDFKDYLLKLKEKLGEEKYRCNLLFQKNCDEERMVYEYFRKEGITK